MIGMDSAKKTTISKGHLVLLLGSLAAIGPLSIDMYLPAFPDVERDLQTSGPMVGATLAVFFVGLCIGQLFYGPASDRLGRRKPLLFGLAVYLAASFGCFFATSITTLFLLRLLQALGACAGMVIGRAMVRDLFEPSEAAKVFSLVILAMGIAPILAPILGQGLTEIAGWRSIFAFMACFGSLAWLAVLKMMPTEATARPTTDKVPLSQRFRAILSDRQFLAFALSGTLIQGGLYAYLTGSPSLFIDKVGLSPQAFSLLFGLNASGFILASQINSRLLRRYPYQHILHRSLQVAALVAVVLAAMGLTGVGGWTVSIPIFIFISSLGLIFPNSTAGALANQGHQAGSASALLGVIQYGGAAIASGVVVLLSHVTSAPLQVTIGLCGVLSIVAFRGFGSLTRA